MFTNYSQTYASAITALAGVAVTILALFGVSVVDSDIELVVGVLVNLGGIIWNLYHRASKGDLTVGGFRK